MPHVLILDRSSTYATMPLHIAQAAAAFRGLGWQTTVYDMGADGAHDGLDALLAQRFDLLFSISYFGHIRHRGKPLAAHLGCPEVVMHLDHPSYFFDWVDQTPPDTIVTWLCDSHIAYVDRQWGPGRFRAQACVPPGGNILRPPDDTNADMFMHMRSIPILFTGTYHGPPQRRWRTEFPADAAAIMDVIADIALSTDELPVEHALDMGLQALGYGPDHPLCGALLRYIYIVSLFVHDSRRHAALTALNAADIGVHVCGKGFGDHMGQFPRFTYGGEGSFIDTLDLVQRAQLVLNTNTNFVWGAHERVFAAQMGGAAVITDTSRWYRQHYTDGQDILLYRWEQIDDLPQRVTQTLSDPQALYAIAAAGRASAEQHHSWTARINDILKLVTSA